MSVPFACVRCRLQISTRLQQLRCSSFVSLENLLKKDNGTLVPDEEVAVRGVQFYNEQDKIKSSTSGSPDGIAIPEDVLEEYRLSHARKHSPPRIKYRQVGRSNALEDLFSSSIRKRHGRTNTITSYSPSARQLVAEDIATLAHKLHKKKESLIWIWQQCGSLLESKHWHELGEESAQQGLGLSEVQLDCFRDILLDIAHARSQNPSNRSVPLVGEVIKLYIQRKIMMDWWDRVLWTQLGTYIRKGLYPKRSGATSAAYSHAESVLVLKEIASVWWCFTSEYGEPSKFRGDIYMGPLEQSSEIVLEKPKGKYRWPGIASNRHLSFPGRPPSTKITEPFLKIFPRYPSFGPSANSTRMAAIMTFDIFDRWKAWAQSPDILIDSEPLIQTLAQFVKTCSITKSTVVNCFQEALIPKLLWNIIMEKWMTLGVHLDINVANVPTTQNSRPFNVNHENDHVNRTLTSASNELVLIREKQDAVAIGALWKRSQAFLSSSEASFELVDHLYSNFLASFFATRLQHEAVNVWNIMINNNHQPRLMHWHAMLVGCSTAKDLISLREIWANMEAAGVEPDTKTWTTRIDGLMHCGAWQEGLEALSTLGKKWKLNEANTNLQPALAPVKVTLSGLISCNKADLLPRIHAFAKSHSLTYDTQTYNILLRPAVRSSSNTTVQTILNDMRTANCTPDTATFTIILNGLVSNPTSAFHTQSPAEQQAAVFSILSDMERTGLSINTYTYSTILDGLLNARCFNVVATQAVMAHMAHNNVKASPHVYTILITHYFSLSPPDLSAISDLLTSAKKDKVTLDPIFYGRMIENYARVGETEKMLSILRRMPEEGKSPGWMALLACLRALVEAREWESVRELVRDVEDEKGLFRHGNGPWRGKDAFWELVAEVRSEGLLGEA